MHIVVPPATLAINEVAALLDGATVEVRETHKSVVFLTASDAYKLKKPIAYNSVDLRPLATRERTCREEVRLNRRLAPDVYLGVVPLTREPGGALALGGRGEVVDWLVHMRRLPADRMLDSMIRDQRVRSEEIEILGTRLARFYAGEPAALIDASGYRGLLLSEMERNHEALSDPALDLACASASILAAHERFLADRAILLDERVAAGRVVNGHGDLRPEHVCLIDPPVVIDCLEFDPLLRIVDPVDELSFLGMGCSRLGIGWIEGLLLGAYSRETGDDPPAELVAFYRSFRATIWARLAAWRLRVTEADNAARWRDRAASYIGEAARFIDAR
ncbi:MAG TPA: hypothetical protein PKA95_14410 [Thermomicrobiales bacterium]|nr:hypothetical protein [Thermomicrobiales bacterium]